jgi:hypothetical protein
MRVAAARLDLRALRMIPRRAATGGAVPTRCWQRHFECRTGGGLAGVCPTYSIWRSPYLAEPRSFLGGEQVPRSRDQRAWHMAHQVIQ